MRPVVGGQPAEHSLQLGGTRVTDRIADPFAVRREADDRRAPIAGVLLADHEAVLLESVDDIGGGSWRDA